MKKKRIVSFLMAAALTAGLFAGCGKQGDDSADGKDGGITAKGRYVEQEIILPEDVKEAVGIKEQDDGLVLYARNENGYSSYVYQNETWTDSGDVTWMTDARERLGFEIEHVYSGEDGNVYGLALPCRDGIPYGQHIIRDAGDGSALDCTPAPCLEVGEEGRTDLFVDMAVLENGTIGIVEMSGMVKFYQDGKKISEISEVIPIVLDFQSVMAIYGESIAVFGKDRESIDFYQTDNFQKTESVSLKQELEETIIVPGGSEIWYVVNAKGIQRITEQGSIVETVMDGSGTLMSTDSAYPEKFICGKDHTFYGLYNISGGGERLMCYRFDEEAQAVRDETLSIYGLKENQTVSQAVYAFQSKHPEVRVDYRSAAEGEGDSVSETIRTLNAELLNGGGADILLLDGLPTASYMEKGILTDLTDLGERLTEKGVLMDVVGNAAVLDGRIYGIPARVSVPVIFGDDEKVNAFQNLDSFHRYMEQNPGEELFGATTHDMTGMTLFNTFYSDLMTKEGGLNEEKLLQFLTDWMKLCEVQGTREVEEKMGLEAGVWKQMSTRFNSGMGLLNVPVMIEEIDGLMSSMVPYTIARESGKTPMSVRQYYVPQVIAGVNASSKQQELAIEFIECLFDESVQKGDNADGFPTLRSGLEYLAEYVETKEAIEMSVGTSAVDPETGEDVRVDAAYPPKEEVSQLIQMIEGLSTPFLTDSMVEDTVFAEMEKCYGGKQSPEDTAKAICRKVDTYLAE